MRRYLTHITEKDFFSLAFLKQVMLHLLNKTFVNLIAFEAAGRVRLNAECVITGLDAPSYSWLSILA